MSRILITGAEGFTGRYLAHELSSHGHEVHGIVRKIPRGGGGLPGLATLQACDLLDADSLARSVAQVRPEKVAHLAAIAFVAHGDVESIYRTNIVGSRNLLSALAQGDNVPSTVLLASSASVYGNATEGVISESVRPSPANDYAVSKLAMEYMAATWQARLPITIARPFNYTGVGQSEDFLLPKIVAHFKRRASVLELGNLDVERDFSDVRAVAQCYRRLLERAAGGSVFNVCSGQGHTLREVLQMMAGLSGYSPEVRVNPAFVRENEVRTLVGSRAALERAIGPVETIPLPDTLTWMMS
jgi:nucleoside-diphosphate-sugar epimerase